MRSQTTYSIADLPYQVVCNHWTTCTGLDWTGLVIERSECHFIFFHISFLHTCALCVGVGMCVCVHACVVCVSVCTLYMHFPVS